MIILSYTNKIPWMAFDFYCCGDEIGLFEYQMEFGYNSLNKKEVCQKLTNSIINIIN